MDPSGHRSMITDDPMNETEEESQLSFEAMKQANSSIYNAGYSSTYTIKSGDTLSGISGIYGTTVDAIVNANGISNPDLIYPGQELIIPNIDARSSDDYVNNKVAWRGRIVILGIVRDG